MGTYKPSLEAQGDLEGIYYMGAVDFGSRLADDYYDGLLYQGAAIDCTAYRQGISVSAHTVETLNLPATQRLW